MSEARRLRARAGRAEADAPPAHQPAQSAPESADDAMAAELQAANAAREAVGSRVVVRTLLAEDRDASVEAVMERAGIGRRRAYELLRQERAALNGGRG